MSADVPGLCAGPVPAAAGAATIYAAALVRVDFFLWMQ
jgi:hypothetical protein